MIKYFPVLLDLTQKKCLVIGGGEVAQRKVFSLLECDAEIVLISPTITEKLQYLVKNHKISYIPREYNPKDLGLPFIVICATGNTELNLAIAAECSKRNILVNVVDSPDSGNFIVPAAIRRGDLCISISTGGHSPALSKKIRQQLESQFGEEYIKYLDLMEEMRKTVIENIPEQKKRAEIFKKLVDSDILDLLKTGQDQLAKERAKQCISL
ncbi:bifunctional precorrin-2 dehydrogenase/sirohydrochlorin ferrochelatase [Bacillota bacterium LX-D]|nr:bifunctional precorrin-2 dehydrogenase/sirohydrochlorin ferrochelatase [Bacillota bacterium LX-D]